MNTAIQSFAILPAAGQSRRMGRPKLLLDFRQRTIVDSVLAAWQSSRVDHVVAVVRRDDRELAERCRAAGAHLVLPQCDPPEMKASVAAGLEYVARRFRPRATDAWLLAPADMPRLSPALIDRLLDEFLADTASILVPCAADQRGHPVVFPWHLAAEVASLGDDQGVNALLERHPVRQLAWPHAQDWEDLDTPEDYRRLRQ